MRIAFDLDGTISKYPRKLLQLAQTLMAGGAEVFVLTAAAGELLPEQRPAEVKKRLAALGWKNVKVVCVESAEKCQYCAFNAVDFLIDDTAFVLNGTGTLLLRIE